eukprot:FR737295.1.p1 GENE.FR737295.1~~FR737295.1.p1  ORF type:complete len:160 (+),score=46.00 FR737295.1:406-885(+)
MYTQSGRTISSLEWRGSKGQRYQFGLCRHQTTRSHNSKRSFLSRHTPQISSPRYAAYYYAVRRLVLSPHTPANSQIGFCADGDRRIKDGEDWNNKLFVDCKSFIGIITRPTVVKKKKKKKKKKKNGAAWWEPQGPKPGGSPIFLKRPPPRGELPFLFPF